MLKDNLQYTDKVQIRKRTTKEKGSSMYLRVDTTCFSCPSKESLARMIPVKNPTSSNSKESL